MKNQKKTTSRKLIRLTALLSLAQLILFRADASIVGPYLADTNTLFLFHLSEPPGSEPGGYNVATNSGVLGGVAYTCTNSQNAAQLTNPPPVNDMLGAAAYPGFGYCLTNTSTSAGLGLVGYDYNRNGRFDSEGTNTTVPGADYMAMTNYNLGNGTNSPFTFEAMICPLSTNGTQEIFCSDSSLAKRGFQFRIAGPSINFNPIQTGSNIVAFIPSSGNNAFVPNTWFHLAVVYDGTNDNVYWTVVNPTNLVANLITNVFITNTMSMTPANIGTNVLGSLTIGNNDRKNTEAFTGRMGEIRVSKVARAANQMLFANGLTLASSPQNDNTSVGGLAIFTVAATSDYALNYQWCTNGVAITNGTDSSGAVFSSANTPTLQIANIQLADAGFAYSCTIANNRPAPGPDSTNSASATLSVIVPHNLLWVGTVNSTWDTTTATNWYDTGALVDTYFTTLDDVTFNDTGTGNPVNFPGAVQPALVTVNSSSVNYTFTGNGGITGLISFTKNNGSKLTIQTTNSYTGVTTLNGGTVSVSQLANGGLPSALGAASSSSANLILNGADLQYTGPTSTNNRGATLGVSGGTVEVTTAGNTLNWGGVIAGTNGGSLTKIGGGALALSGANTYNGQTTISTGTLQLVPGGSFGSGNVVNNSSLSFSGSSSANNIYVTNNISGTGILTNDTTGGNVILSGNNSFSGNIYFNGPGQLNFASANALGNTTNVTLLGSAASPYSGLGLTNNESVFASVALVAKASSGLRTSVNAGLSANGGGTWNGPVTLMSSDGGGTFQFGAGSTNSSSPLVFNGNITSVNFSPSTAVQFRNSGAGGARYGTLNGSVNLGTAQAIINDGAYWTLNSSGNTWEFLEIANGKFTLGKNNALPTNAPLIIGSGGSTAVFDLAGYSQQIAGLTNNGTTGVSAITNSSTTPVTLTYNNPSSTTYNNFTNSSASIKDTGAGTISLAIAGGSLLLQNNANNSYHGITAISGTGVLMLSGTAQITNSTTITVTGSAAKLDVSTVTGGFVLAKSQNLSGNGVVTGAVTVASGALITSGNSNVGTLSFSNNLTLNASSTNNFAVTTIGGASNTVVVAGLLSPNSSVVKITSGTPLHPGTNMLFAYGTSSGAFNATPVFDVTPVHPAAIIDSGAGQIYLAIPNHPPVAAPFTVTRLAGTTFKIPVSSVATNWSDPDGDTVTLTNSITSTNGAMIGYDSTYIYYTNNNFTADQINYTITDGYGGFASGIIYVQPSSGGPLPSISMETVNHNGSFTLGFVGTPGTSYSVQTTTNLVAGWTTIGSNTAGTNGSWQFTDTNAANSPTRYYRTTHP